MRNGALANSLRLTALLAALVANCSAHDSAPVPNAPTLAPRTLAPLWIGPAFSGSWYNPARSGEGFTLQILDNGTALAVWFTYPPAGSNAKQAWIFAQDGQIDADGIHFANVFTTRGPRFGTAYDPSQLQVIAWGSLDIRFTGCNSGEFSYAGPAAWGSGSGPLVRLTALSELECSGKKQLGAAGARALSGLQQRSGGIFDPSHNGEGWMLEELANGQTLVYWFTYDASGEQAWTLGVSNTSGSNIAIADNLQPVGTHFGTGFDPAQISAPRWGSLQLDFTGCDSGTVSYQSTASGDGTLHPIRLTRLAGNACVEGTPAIPSGTWSAGARMPDPAQSELAIAVLGNRAYAGGGYLTPFAFKSYVFDTDSWSIGPAMPGGRDHALGIAFGNKVYVTGGNRGSLEGEEIISGFRYDPGTNQWSNVPQLPDVLASGATMLDGFAYFGNAGGDVYQLNTQTLATRRIPPDPANISRDHSQLVAFHGELWMIGGRNLVTGVEHGRVSIFDPASETWRAGPTLQNTRGGFAAASSSSLVIVAGGERLVGQLRVLNSVEAIVPGAQAWTAMPSLPVGVHGVGGAIYNNAFYAIGGSVLAGAAANQGDVQVFRWGP